MKLLHLFYIFVVFFFLNTTHAQQKVINIWTGDIPGAIKCPEYKVVIDSDQYWTRVRNISIPTLDYYPALSDKSNGTAVIICPGGAYKALAYRHEGYQVAAWLNSLGITAFVLKYRLPNDSIMIDKTVGPLQDAQEAIRLVRRHAREWNITPNKIGVIGFSAGGHLASTISTHFNEKVYDVNDSTSARPDFSLLIYPVISMDTMITHRGSRDNLLGKNPNRDLVRRFSNDLQVNEHTPPAFIVHSMDDRVVPVQNSINYGLALNKFDIPAELHIYETGGHGYGLGRSDDTESSWPEACKKWLKARGFL
jgi:acetyl esterase/lipase